MAIWFDLKLPKGGVTTVRTENIAGVDPDLENPGRAYVTVIGYEAAVWVNETQQEVVARLKGKKLKPKTAPTFTSIGDGKPGSRGSKDGI